MTENSVKGLSFYIDTDKGEEKIAEFEAAIARVTKSLGAVGGAVDKADAAFGKFGATSKGAPTVMQQTATQTAALVEKTKSALPALQQMDAGLGRVVRSAGATASAQKLLADSSRATGAALALLAETGAATGLGRIATATVSAGSAFRGFGALVATNPLGALATAASVAASAFLLLGDDTEKTSRKFDEYIQRAKDAEAASRRLADSRRDFIAGEAGSAARLLEDSLRQVAALKEQQRRGLREVPLESLLGAIEPIDPHLVGNLRAVTDEIAKLGEKGEAATGTLATRFAELSGEVRDRFGVQIRRVGDEVTHVFGLFSSRTFGSRKTAVKSFLVPIEDTLRAIIPYIDQLAGKAGMVEERMKAAAAAINTLRTGPLPKDDSSGRGGDKPRADAVEELIRKRAQEVALLGKTDDELYRGKLLQDAWNAAVQEQRPLRLEELALLEAISRAHKKGSDAATKESRGKAAEEILDNLRNQIAALQEVGAARTALQRSQETMAAFDKLEIDAGDERYKQAQQYLAILGDLLVAEEKRNKASRGDNRREVALLQLQQEEKLVNLVGAARERYTRTIEAENDARRAGLALGSAEFDDYVRRKIALRELSDAQEQLARFGQQAGEAVGSSLERVVFDSEKARDAIRALAEDLGRLAFRQTVTQGLSQVLGAAGNYLATILNGTSTTPPPVNQQGLVGGFNSGTAPRLAGGVIPAMAGTVVDEFSFLRRGGQTFSIAEGGKTTPEGIFRLAKDSKGNLGVTAVGGGGGDTYNMSFPSVRTAQDARNVRMTASQRVKAALAANRSGRIGLRPPQ